MVDLRATPIDRIEGMGGTELELGIKAATTTLQVMVAPKGLPHAVSDKLADTVMKISAQPNIVKLFHENLTMRMRPMRGKELVDYMVAEEKRFTDLIAGYDDGK